MQDLSKLAKGFPSYGASMAGGNTVTEPIDQASGGAPAPGSTSEATNDIDATHGTSPNLDMVGMTDCSTVIGNHPAPLTAETWKKTN